MKKRVISLLLALVLAVSLLPTAAWAARKTLSEYFNGMPISANGGTGTTAWKVSGDTLMSGSAGKSHSTSTLTLTFTADTAISFEYRVSSEEKYDNCTITLGDTTIEKDLSGNGNWTGYTGTAKNGDQLVVTYKKDGSGDKNDDCVYLRNFTCGTPIVVTLHANNGTDVTSTQNIYGGKGTLKANKFTKSGKVFAGWATSAGGAVVYPDGATIENVTSDFDLYAVWGDAYTVTFDYNDGKTGNATVDVAQNTAIGAAKCPRTRRKRATPLRAGSTAKPN